jgi:hypothetical protein
VSLTLGWPTSTVNSRAVFSRLDSLRFSASEMFSHSEDPRKFDTELFAQYRNFTTELFAQYRNFMTELFAPYRRNLTKLNKRVLSTLTLVRSCLKRLS